MLGAGRPEGRAPPQPGAGVAGAGPRGRPGADAAKTGASAASGVRGSAPQPGYHASAGFTDAVT